MEMKDKHYLRKKHVNSVMKVGTMQNYIVSVPYYDLVTPFIELLLIQYTVACCLVGYVDWAMDPVADTQWRICHSDHIADIFAEV